MSKLLGTIKIEALETLYADRRDVDRIGQDHLKMGMDFEMEEVNCPICEGSGGEPLHLEGSFQMVRCPSCQFIFLNPRPTSESLHFVSINSISRKKNHRLNHGRR